MKVSRASALAFRIAKLLLYECRRHDTPAKPRVKWGQSPKWNPGYTRTKVEWAPTRSGTTVRAFALCRIGPWLCVLVVSFVGECRSCGAQKCVKTINPGLALWAMQECRPVGLFDEQTQKQYQYVVLIFVITHTYLGDLRPLHGLTKGSSVTA